MNSDGNLIRIQYIVKPVECLLRVAFGPICLIVIVFNRTRQNDSSDVRATENTPSSRDMIVNQQLRLILHSTDILLVSSTTAS